MATMQGVVIQMNSIETEKIYICLNISLLDVIAKQLHKADICFLVSVRPSVYLSAG